MGHIFKFYSKKFNYLYPLKQYYTDIYNQCITSCPPADFVCISTCAREFDENKNKCPCQAGCPNGCPCPDYQCPAIESTTTGVTTTTPVLPGSSVLILNTRSSSNEAVITDGNGKEEHAGDDFRFTFGENTEVECSCSITWHGELFIFGD